MRIRRWTCRQLLVSIALISAVTLAFVDTEFREDYGELLGVIVGGYFGQQLPQSGDRACMMILVVAQNPLTREMLTERDDEVSSSYPTGRLHKLGEPRRASTSIEVLLTC